MLFGSASGQRLEPMGIVCSTFGNSPLLHRVSNDGSDVLLQRNTLFNSLFDGLIGFLGELVLHNGLAENHTAVQSRYVGHFWFLLKNALLWKMRCEYSPHSAFYELC